MALYAIGGAAIAILGFVVYDKTVSLNAAEEVVEEKIEARREVLKVLKPSYYTGGHKFKINKKQVYQVLYIGPNDHLVNVTETYMTWKEGKETTAQNFLEAALGVQDEFTLVIYYY